MIKNYGPNHTNQMLKSSAKKAIKMKYRRFLGRLYYCRLCGYRHYSNSIQGKACRERMSAIATKVEQDERIS